jgi:hypothetical protein
MAIEVMAEPHPHPTTTDNFRPFPHERILLIVVLLLALLLRLRGITRFSFEQDELYTVMESTDLFSTKLIPGINARPLYFLMQHVLLDILPSNELGLRIVPLIFAMLGVWVTATAARKIFGGYAGVLAGLLVAIAPWHMHESTFARYWSLTYLLSSLFFLFLWQSYRTDRKSDYLKALAVLLPGSATHPSFVFVAFAATVGISLVRENGRFGIRFPSRSSWKFLWVPYLLFIAAAFAALKLTGTSNSLQNWGGRGVLASLRLLPAVVEWLHPTLLTAGLLGGLVAASSRDSLRRSWGMLAVVGFSGTLLLLLLASLRTDIYADYAFAALPLIFVSAGGLVHMLGERAATRRGVTVIAATALLVSSIVPGTASHLSDGTRFEYRPAFAHILRTAPKVTTLTWPAIIAYHYEPEIPVRGLFMTLPYLDSMLVAQRDLWVIASIRRYGMVVDDAGQVTRWISRHCTLEGSYEKPRWDYRLYRVNLHRCQAS